MEKSSRKPSRQRTDDLDRIKGILFGAGLGDALGAPFEFRYSLPLSKYNGKLEYPIKWYNRFKDETLYSEVGQVSDDTEMMLILARSLVANGKYDSDKVTLDYMGWANSSTTKFMGRNTRGLFKGVKTPRGYRSRYAKSKTTPTTQSNGALMRCAILALIPLEDALRDCALTNPHKVCLKVNEIYLTLVSICLESPKLKPRASIRKKLKGCVSAEGFEEEFPEIALVIHQALNRIDRDITESKGWCMHGLYCAIYALLHFTDYKTAIDYIIRKGGDTDTNACIAGALMGAYYGFEGIQKVEEENLRILKGCTTLKGDLPRNEKYRMCDADMVAYSLSRLSRFK